jgi:Ca-activated chloride channel family protein
MPSFQYPYFLYLLGLIPLLVLLYVYALREKQKASARIGQPVWIQRLIASYSPARYFVKFLLISLASVLLILALANPRVVSGKSGLSKKGIDVMLALDVSKSMLAQDLKPSRLERARQLLSKLAEQLEGNRVGLVIFAGHAYVQMPLTTDVPAAKMYINTVSTESVPTQGTVIGEALDMCNQSFDQKEKKYKAIVLVSDGEDHDAAAESQARQLAEQGVMILTVGMGSPGGAPVFDPETNANKRDKEGNEVISVLNEAALKSIAAKGNGRYFYYAQTDEVVAGLTREIKGVEQRAINDNSGATYQSYYPYLLALALILLLMEWLMSDRYRRRLVKPALAVLLFFVAPAAQAQHSAELIQEGIDAYNQKNYAKAIDKFTQAKASPKAAPVASYNLGNALFKAGKTDEALRAYDEALNGLKYHQHKSNAWYNKGVLWQKQQKLPECIDAYKRSLKLDPANEDARLNLQRALQEQKKQQDQQRKDQQKDKKKQDQPNEQKQKDSNDQSKKQPNEAQQPKMSKAEAERQLKNLMQYEKQIQDRLQKARMASPVKPEKDW